MAKNPHKQPYVKLYDQATEDGWFGEITVEHPGPAEVISGFLPAEEGDIELAILTPGPAWEWAIDALRAVALEPCLECGAGDIALRALHQIYPDRDPYHEEDWQ
jgi:hypothetical protein